MCKAVLIRLRTLKATHVQNMSKKKKIVIGSLIALGIILSGIVCFRAIGPMHHSGLHVTAEAIQLSGGWGYKIDVNNHPFIYQNQIPGVPGNKPFPTKGSAMAVADLVMNKIEHGQLPSVTPAELKSLTGIKAN